MILCVFIYPIYSHAWTITVKDANSANGGELDLSWQDQSMSECKLYDYEIYVDGHYKYTTWSTSYTLSGLTNGNTYSIL